MTRAILVAAVLTAAPPAFAGPPGMPWRMCVDAAAPHHATVVVSHLDPTMPSPKRVCVGFEEDHITGHELLRRSGVEAGLSEYGGNGSAVCQLDNEPASYDPNNCLRAGRPYWSIWQAPYGGAWGYTRFGIDGVTIHDGDAEGFRYAQNQGPPDAPGGACPAPAAANPPASGSPAPGTAPSQPGGGSTSSSARRHTTSGGPVVASPAPADASAQAAATASGAPPGAGETALAPPPSPTGTPPRPRLPPAPAAPFPHDRLGLAVAGVGALILALFLCAQLLLPRWRG